MEKRLIPHPSSPAPAFELTASLRDLSLDVRVFRFEVRGDMSRMVLPRAGPGSPARRDHLWQTTCFEAFSRAIGATHYREFNFSPSGDWAVYAFDDYRTGMSRPLVGQAITVGLIKRPDLLVVEGIVSTSDLAGFRQFNMAAVIEEVSGRKSYWALRHPSGDKPDFHHPDCFALEVSPASGA